jgi:glucosamine-6-phosphate deaminase
MERELFGRRVIPHACRIPRRLRSDLDAECERYERAIIEAGGIDLMMLGIGANGHIGFNEPARDSSRRTHRARLHGPTRASNAALVCRRRLARAA